MKIAAFDLGTNVGWATLEADADDVFGSGILVRSGVKNFSPKAGDHAGKRDSLARRFFLSVAEGCDLISYEQINFVITEDRNVNQVRVHFGIEGQMKAVAFDLGLPLKSFMPSQIKKEATGFGNASKDLVLQKARIQFKDQHIASNDQADALWILRLAASFSGIDMGRHIERLNLGV